MQPVFSYAGNVGVCVTFSMGPAMLDDVATERNSSYALWTAMLMDILCNSLQRPANVSCSGGWNPSERSMDASTAASTDLPLLWCLASTGTWIMHNLTQQRAAHTFQGVEVSSDTTVADPNFTCCS